MQINKNLSEQTQTLLKEKAEQFELMMQERVEANNEFLDAMDAEAKDAPEQPKVDMQDLLVQIVHADDGKMPSEKSRHNLVDPEPIDVLNFCVEYMDACDQKIARLENALKLLASYNTIAIRDTILKELEHDEGNHGNG